MVNTEEIKKIMEKYVITTGPWQLNAQGEVDVQGHVAIRNSYTHDKIPVKFGHVQGLFDARDVGLRSLENSPTRVDGGFKVSGNLLTSLAHAPVYVGGDFEANDNPRLTNLDFAHTHVAHDLDIQNCALTNLNSCAQVKGGVWVKHNHIKDTKGIPECEYVYIEYLPDLALLPLLRVQEINLRNITPHFPDRPDASATLRTIMKKYQGKGKAAALNCALELKQSGFGSNARW